LETLFLTLILTIFKKVETTVIQAVTVEKSLKFKLGLLLESLQILLI